MKRVVAVLLAVVVTVLVNIGWSEAGFAANSPPNIPPPPPVNIIGMTPSQRAWYSRQGFPNPTPNRWTTGYKNFHGVGKYKVHRDGLPWNQALNVCAGEGAILAVINDVVEAETIKNLIIGASPHGNEVSVSGQYYYWIGAKEFGTNMQFFTLHGDILGHPGYLRWSESNAQPDNYGNDDCVGIMHDGKNFDAVCSELLGFVCEKVT